MSKAMLFRVTFAVLLVVVLAVACGSSAPATVSEAWARPIDVEQGADDVNAAVYFTLENTGGETLRLTDIETDVARVAELHQSSVHDGVMHMEHLADFDISPSQRLELKPGSYHVMLIGVNRRLNMGDEFEVALRFSNGESTTAKVQVRNATP